VTNTNVLGTRVLITLVKGLTHIVTLISVNYMYFTD